MGLERRPIMTNATVNELRKKNDAAWERIERQLAGMEAHLERAHAPGQWTTRQVLCHLLFEPGSPPTGPLKCFSATDLPLIYINPSWAPASTRPGSTSPVHLAAPLDSPTCPALS